MGIVYNPLLSVGLDQRGTGGGASVAGSNTEIQYNDNGSLGASADLTWDDTGKVLGVGGDVDLDDGGTYTTTLQTITATANRTISFPDATGTVGLVAGSSGQLIYNSAGANAGVSGSVIGATGDVALSLAGAADTPPLKLSGTWFSGGTATTTKPQVLIEPSGTTSTAWSTSGTGLGVNAASGFTGNLLDLQVNGSSLFKADANTTRFWAGSGFISGLGGVVTVGNITGGSITIGGGGDLRLSANASVNWNNDTFFVRDGAAGILAQRNGTNAQAFCCYGTYTDASNYVRAALSSTSTAVTLAAETAGTGADDIPLNLTAAGTGTVKANSNLELADAKDIVLGTTTGTKIGTATTQKIGFYNATPVVQPTAVADITTTATSGSLPTPDGTVTIADATTPTVTELLEYCVELEAKLEAALGHLRTLGLIAT